MNNIAVVLKERREAFGMSKSELGRKLGVSSQLIGHYETGKSKPKPEFYLKWKRVFGEDLLAYNHESDYSKLALNIKTIRQVYGLSQEEFAVLVGSTEPNIKSYEGGRAKPNYVVLMRMSALAAVEFEEMLLTVIPSSDVEFVKSQAKGIDLTKPLDPILSMDLKFLYNAKLDRVISSNHKWTFSIISKVFDQSVSKKIEDFLLDKEAYKTSLELEEIVTLLEDYKSSGEDPGIRLGLREKLIKILRIGADIAKYDEIVAETKNDIDRLKQVQDKSDMVEGLIKSREERLKELPSIRYNQVDRLSRLLAGTSEFTTDKISFNYLVEKFYVSEEFKISELEPFQSLSSMTMPFFESSTQLVAELAKGYIYLGGITRKYGSKPFIVPGLEDCDFAMTLWGGSLSLVFKSGDILVFKFVRKDEEWSFVRSGESYLVIEEKGPLLVTVQSVEEKEFFAFKSLTQEGPEYRFAKKDILQLCQVRGVVTRIGI